MAGHLSNVDCAEQFTTTKEHYGYETTLSFFILVVF
jgi:hypothetical protein